MPTGFVAGGIVPDPVAITASVLFGAKVPDATDTFVATSPENATRPLVAPGERPAGLPQEATRAIPIRSPVCTETAGVRATVCVLDVASNGPRSATNASVSPARRKNLILTVPAHGTE